MENYVEVIKRIQTNPGDEDAVNALVTDYWDYGVRTARSVLMQYENLDSTVIEDLLQNSWIKVLKNINSLTEQRGFAAWYSRIITNTCIDYLRSSAVRFERSMPQVQNDEDDFSSDIEIIDDTIDHQPEMAYDQQARKAIIADVLKQLSPEQRQVIVMRYYEGLSMKDISERLGIPMSTVEGRSRVASVKIRDSVTEIQKRDDIKLYNLTPLPFFIWLLRDNEETIKIPHDFVPKIMDGAGRIATATAAETLRKSAESAAAATSKASGASGMTKILISVAVAAAAFGGGYAVMSKTGKQSDTSKTAVTEPSDHGIIEENDNAEEPVIEETPEPVKEVTWVVKPQFAFTEVRELLPYFIPYGAFEIHPEKIGYPEDWEYNATGNRFGEFTCDAIEVAQGNKSGVYDFSGNERYPVTLTKNVLNKMAAANGDDGNAIIYWYLNFVPQNDTTKMFTKDFSQLVENDVPVWGLVPGPESLRVVDQKLMAYSMIDNKTKETTYTYGVYGILDEYDTAGTLIGKAIVDNNGNYVAHVQSDQTDNMYIVNKMLKVAESGKWGYQSAQTGELVTDYIYDEAKDFIDGYAPVKKNEKWGFVDENGKEVTEFIFDDASMLYHGNTYVSIDGVYGILNLPEVLESGASVTAETCHADPEAVQKAKAEKESMMLPIGTATVHVGNLNVRKAPTTGADLAAPKRSIEDGSVFEVYAIKEADGYTWYQINDDMWIASDGTWVTYKEN